MLSNYLHSSVRWRRPQRHLNQWILTPAIKKRGGRMQMARRRRFKVGQLEVPVSVKRTYARENPHKHGGQHNVELAIACGYCTWPLPPFTSHMYGVILSSPSGTRS